MSIPGRFMIIVDGKPVGNPQDNGEPMIQAQPGDPAAIFELRDGRLFSGEWALGRLNFEDRSMMPKRVLWRRREEVESLQPVQVQEYGGPPELKFSGMLYHTAALAVLRLTTSNRCWSGIYSGQALCTYHGRYIPFSYLHMRVD
ncbi:hypothetical protein LB503_010206 [Fusarium chuoi]|nr:hypothetical protein LB503_010206 [Fusarium chuoi]